MLAESCPSCEHHYEREEGYWVSAIIVNTAVTEALFGVLFVGGIFVTAPDVQWLPLLVIGVVANLVVPVLFFPFSKTVWVALDLYFNPPDRESASLPDRTDAEWSPDVV